MKTLTKEVRIERIISIALLGVDETFTLPPVVPGVVVIETPVSGIWGPDELEFIMPITRRAMCKAISGRYMSNVARKNLGKCSAYSANALRNKAPVPSAFARRALAKPAAVAGRSAGFFASAVMTSTAILFGSLRRFSFNGGGAPSM